MEIFAAVHFNDHKMKDQLYGSKISLFSRFWLNFPNRRIIDHYNNIDNDFNSNLFLLLKHHAFQDHAKTMAHV
jgi:hypothetical protein